MKVLYIHQYYRTPEEGGGIRSYHLTCALVKRGVDVEVITAHNSKGGTTENIDGVKVHYLPIFYDNALPFSKRAKAFLQFAVLAIRMSYSIKSVDISYVMTTPLTTGLVALWYKWFRRVPYVFEVGDVWPLVPWEMGIIKNKALVKLLFWFERVCYVNAKGIVALSPAIADYVKKIVPNKPIEVITNIADTSFFMPSEKELSIKKKYHLKEEFVISYIGTLGMANHLEYLLEAAESTRELSVKYLIVGVGAEKEQLQEIKEKSLLDNVQFLDATDKRGIKEIMNITDGIYISFAQYPSLATGSPNKLFDGLAAGKLIIINFDGWIKKLIESNDAGFSYNPMVIGSFTEKLLVFLNNKEILRSFQRNSRQLAENSFSLEDLSQRQYQLLLGIMTKQA